MVFAGTFCVGGGRLFDEERHLGDVGDRGVTGEGKELVRVGGAEAEGSEAAHGEAVDEMRGVEGIAGGFGNGVGDILDDPLSKILRAVRKVATAVTPKTVGGHREDYRWEFSGIDELLQSEVSFAHERPNPVTAPNAVEENDDGNVF